MANFMGPMAPPPAASGQPPQLDIRTNPNQRQRFRNFMRQNTRPAGMTGVPPMYPASQTPFPAAPMPPMAMPAPAPIMPMQMAQPMRPPMQQPMGPARNVDIFSPQYMQAQPPVGMADGGDVPMPTVAPNSKQKDVMLRIAYDEALREGAVENALRQLETDRVIERSKQMELDRIRDIERQDRLDAVKRMRLEAELADRNYRLKGLLTPPDQGLEDDPLFALPIKKEDGGAVPPRRVDIRGQDHMLSYITPEEAGILKALGGAGKPGPMGIPSYYDEGDGMGSSGGDQAGQADGSQGAPDGGNVGGGGDTATPGDPGERSAADAAQAAAVSDAVGEQAAGQQGQYDSHAGDTTVSDAETDDPVTAGKQSSEYDSEVSIFGVPEDERNFVERNIISRIQDKGLKGLSIETDEEDRVTGYTAETTPFGALGFLSSVFDMPVSTYTGFGKGAGISDGSDMGGDRASEIVDETIAATTVPQPPVSNVMGGVGSSYVAPPSLPSPLVPSDRAYTPTNLPMPVGYGTPQTGYINPLAYLTSGFPVGTQFFADGGQVLDQAAGRFLEALTAA